LATASLFHDLLHWLDYVGVAVFALSGALAAARKGLDPFGFMVIGVATGVGGGTLRDILLDLGPVFWVTNPNFLAVAVLSALFGWFIAQHLKSRLSLLVWADAVGLAIFAVLGAEKAYAAHSHWAVVAVMGMVSATFGGLVRDILCNELPLLLHKEIYALAAFAGAVTYFVGVSVFDATVASLFAGAAVCFLIRAAAIRYNLALPAYKQK